MKFRTELSVPSGSLKISHSDTIAMMGSCFTENISVKLSAAGFNIDVNPFGTVYNPLSLSLNLNRLMDEKLYVENELVRDKDLFHSFAHHSRFSGTNLPETLEKINSRLEHSSAFLQKANILIITFGTAFVYRLQTTGAVVSNCHKLPASLFIHERMGLVDHGTEWNHLVKRLKKYVPGIKILFTVSPLRYLKDGFHENQLSKATLLLAIEKITCDNPDTYYFPSYEIVMDDLRDYRFYAEDLIHPSEQAIDYVWEKFSETYFDKETQQIVREFESVERALRHEPFYPESAEYKKFMRKIEEKKREIFVHLHPIQIKITMKELKRVVAIHDISGFGKCSLTVALPIISSAGIETTVLPTAVLSTHTGGFTSFTYRDLTEDIQPIADHWKSLGIGFDAIYTGFLGSFEQLDLIGRFFDTFKTSGNLILVDPVMADNGELYKIFTPEFAAGMSRLCRKADIIVPNLTEAALLLGESYNPGPYDEKYISELLKKLSALGPKQVVLTGVFFDEKELGAAAYDARTGEIAYSFENRVPGYYHGTGDVFGSALLAAVMNGFSLSEAAGIAVRFTTSAIRKTAAAGTDIRFGVNFEQTIPEFLKDLKILC